MISIVLCSYNGDKFIRQQIESILNQTYQDFELIIIDDLSSDNTINIIREFRELDGRITFFENESNLGPRLSFYKGIYQTKGEFIALCDQDDVWLPQKLERLLKVIQQEDAMLVFANSQNINSIGEFQISFLSDIINFYSGNDNRIVSFYNFVWGHTMMFNRKLIQYFEPVPEGFNHDKWIPFLALTYGNVLYIDEVLQYYRHHENNLTVKDKRNALSNDPKIKEGHPIEWIRYISKLDLPKNQNFFKAIISKYDEGFLGKLYLFFFFLKNIKIVLFPVKKNYLKKLNFLRKVLSG